MRVLVTGGVGFVGTNLIKRLLKDGHEVVSIDNYSTGFKENEQEGCEYHNFNLQHIYDFDSYMENPDVVFHLAAAARIQPSFEKPQYYIKTNIVGTQHVVQFCVDRNIPLIYAGSSSHHSGKPAFHGELGNITVEIFETMNTFENELIVCKS